MIKLFKVTNPFAPSDGMEESSHSAGYLSEICGEYHSQPFVVMAYINGESVLPTRDEWETTYLNDGDLVYLIPAVAGEFLIPIILVVISVAATVVALSIKPPKPNQIDSPDPVYGLKGGRNQRKLGAIVEDPYGRNRLWPTYAADPYNVFSGNEQFQFQLFCLGHGSYDLEEPHIEDTPFSNFQEIEYQIAQPGESITLFPDNVETSVEVGNSILLGTNEVGYAIIGPFTANSAGTLANRLEVDIVLPKGLYLQRSNGKLAKPPVEILIQYRLFGTADPWLTLKDLDLNTGVPSTRFSSVDPLRYTFGVDVAPGRYEVRAFRENDAWPSIRASDEVQWVALRAFLPSTKDYGDKTMMAVKARATNQLNDSSSNRVNIYATRKLPNYTPGSPGTLAAPDDYVNRTASRNPIWALVNLLRAKYTIELADSFLDLAHLAAEATEADTQGITFDWIYDSQTTAWEAIKLPLFIFKSIPIFNGSLVTTVRDKAGVQPSFFINPENTINGSFSLERRLYDVNSKEGVLIEYLDQSTSEKEVVECLLPGQTNNKMRRIQGSGISDRQKAFELGMYLNAQATDERQVVNVSTGLEGMLPTYGDLGRISSYAPNWSQNGYLKGFGGNIFYLSEPVIFEPSGVHQIAIRGKRGQDLGPYTVVAGGVPTELITSDTVDPSLLNLTDQGEPPYFMFGLSSVVGRICRVKRVRPNGDESVSITAVVNNESRFADFGTAPALGSVTVPPVIPAAPVVTDLNVIRIPDDLAAVNVTWRPTFGATAYEIERSEDGVNWRKVDTISGSSYRLEVDPDATIYVRVAAIRSSIGPWATWTGTVGEIQIPDNVDTIEVNPVWTGQVVYLKWTGATDATTYLVKVYTDTGSGMTLRATKEVSTLFLEYPIDDAVLDGARSREIRFDVVGKNSLGESDTPATITVNNPVPTKLTGLKSTLVEDLPSKRTYRLEWSASVDSDILFYKVWLDDSVGFVVSTSNVIAEGTETNVLVSVTPESDGFFPPYFWKVSPVDVWGDDVTLSDEQILGESEFISTLAPNIVGLWDKDRSAMQTDVVTDFNTGFDYLGISDASQNGLSDLSSLAIALWIKAPADSTAETLVSKWSTVGSDNEYRLRKTATNTIEFEISHDGSAVVSAESTTLVNDTWQLIVATYDGITIKLFINGALEASTASTGALWTGVEPFRLGRTADDLETYTALMSEVGFWSRGMTLVEVKELFDRGISGYSALTDNNKFQLVSFWENNEPTGTHYDSHGSNDLVQTTNSLQASAGPGFYRGDVNAGVSRWRNRGTALTIFGDPVANTNRAASPKIDETSGVPYWSGSARSLKLAGGSLNQAFTLVFYVSDSGGSSSGVMFISDSTEGVWFGRDSSSLEIAGNAGTLDTSGQFFVAQKYILVVDGASSVIYGDGFTVPLSIGVNDMTGLSIGGGYLDAGTTRLTGKVRRVMLIDKALSAGEAASMLLEL